MQPAMRRGYMYRLQRGGMLGLKKGCATALVAALLLMSGAGSAMASAYWQWPPDNDVTMLPSGTSISGTYYVTPVGFYSPFTIDLYAQGNILFTNMDLLGTTSYPSAKLADLTGSYFYNRNTGQVDSLVNNYNIIVGQLVADHMVSCGVLLLKDSLVFGLEARNGTPTDFEDFILFASKTDPLAAPTPIPGALWLLGSGLVGLAGFKRVRKTA